MFPQFVFPQAFFSLARFIRLKKKVSCRGKGMGVEIYVFVSACGNV